ncbi:hypothetical protein DS2_06241 [Catenovulum agarivorans DS-2]|uniref:Late embryogenesis abundant protein n=1 Tax=Catenovulum agarivorans DS-2 TaxID=1328313 RepID=W7QSL9_9ALTE|nr:hypothetical protein [Catenovulum agarivorans]EWH10868.1 hypothetical protein DS2_06241 [Catenovulum agarivorans DS-2]
MNNFVKSTSILAAILASLTLSACGESNAEDAGEKIDSAMESAGDKIEDAATDAGNAVEDACEEVKEGVNAKDQDC